MIKCRQDEERGRERCYVAGLEHGGKEAQAKDCRRPLEAEKAEGTDFFPAPPKGAQPCRHLDCRTPDLPNCKIIKSVLFEAIKFVICYSSHGKPIQQVCKGPRDERSWGSRLNPSQLEDPTFPSCHSLPYNTVCVCVCVCASTCSCTRVYACTSTEARAERTGTRSFRPAPGLWLDGTAGHAVRYPPQPSLLGASGEMLSPGTQRERSVTGAQLIRGDPPETSKWGRDTGEQERERKRKKQKERELRGP